jgi:hypothetical protein
MKRSVASRGKLFIVPILLFLVTAQAQNANQKETCKGPVYLGSEVDASRHDHVATKS